jgi:hypothetical protein
MKVMFCSRHIKSRLRKNKTNPASLDLQSCDTINPTVPTFKNFHHTKSNYLVGTIQILCCILFFTKKKESHYCDSLNP